jgi:2'-5' RNA ligase
MDHVVIPLDDDHVGALRSLQRRAGVPPGADAHITLVSYEGVDHDVAVDAIDAAAAGLLPLAVRAHGYGLFVGDGCEVSVHVPVVRDDALNGLHRSVVASLRDAGASVAGWTEPARWTPHVTVASGSTTPAAVSRLVARLVGHAHPSWRVPVRELRVVGGRVALSR